MANTIEDSFNVTDSETSERTVDAINTSFKSIEEMIEDFTPFVTSQSFAVLQYSGYLEKDQEIKGFTPPSQTINVFGVIGASYWLVGVLNTDGVFTSSVTQLVTINQPYKTV